MDDGKLENLIKPLVNIYSDLELELIKDIAIRLNTYDGVKGSLKWYMDKLEDIGGFNKNNLKLLSHYSKKSQSEIKRIFKEVGYDVSSFEKYKNTIDDDVLKKSTSSLYNSVTIKNIVNETINETNTIMKTIQTQALESAKREYMQILTDSYIKVSSGVYSYDQIIKQSLKDMAKNGITGVTYKSGIKLNLESTARRDILTKCHQLSGNIELEKAKELGTNLVYVTQHLGARVRTKYTKEDYEAHAEWQGKVYMIDGISDKYDNFYDKTGYGKLLGLCGVNCRHHFFATFEGMKHPILFNEEENEKAYILSQKQRQYERNIRTLKKRKEVDRILNDVDDIKKVNIKLKKVTSEYNDFLKNNNLQRDYNREYIEKSIIHNENNFILFNDNIIEKDFKNHNKDVEHLFIYDINTREKLLEVHPNQKSSVGGIKPFILVAKSKPNSLLMTHNHPSNSSFSFNDIDTFNMFKSIDTIVVQTDKYLYYLEKNGINKVNPKELQKLNNIIRKKYIQKYGQKKETLHKINEEISKKVGWNYGRLERKQK